MANAMSADGDLNSEEEPLDLSDYSIVSIQLKMEGEMVISPPETIILGQEEGVGTAILTLLLPRGEDRRVKILSLVNEEQFDLIVNSEPPLSTFWGVEPSSRLRYLRAYGQEEELKVGENDLLVQGSPEWVNGQERYLHAGAFTAPYDSVFRFEPDSQGCYTLSEDLKDHQGAFRLELTEGQRVGVYPYVAEAPKFVHLRVTTEEDE
ncbi:hypothetical protein JXA05_00915 [Candidatus Peregrinibacteria bacterium]|nr:hypothetical protein [Candidatus Peregrinibacteria bacterium]